MYLSKFQLFNYKSFFGSGLLKFSSGINIIIGQNNSGKTALLEALTLNFENVQHQSIKNLPNSFLVTRGRSGVQISFKCHKNEFFDFLDQLIPLQIPYSKNDELNPNHIVTLFQKWLNSLNDQEFNLSILGGGENYLAYHPINDKIFGSLHDLTFGLYEPAQPQPNGQYTLLTIKRYRDDDFGSYSTSLTSISDTILLKLLNLYKNRIYRFYAERLNVGSCAFGNSDQLKPDASNLAEVLNVLDGKNPYIFDCFNQLITVIFPQIKKITVIPNSSSTIEIRVWPIAPQANIAGLSFPLSACGTGVGQVLAILYVVLTSQEPRIIIIDEPQSFLHPGAAKKLVEILREFPQHQYFIATHSPMIIAAANPSTIVKLRYEDGETKASVMNSEDVKEQRSLLFELGVSLSDVFGSDNILWVEGETEELCFPIIVEKILKKPLRGTTITRVRSTGELVEQKNKNITEIIFDIYNQLSTGKSLVPPAIGFVFDSEGKPEPFQKDIERKSRNLVKFLKRRMYENYLLHADAITSVLKNSFKQWETLQDKSIAVVEVQEWLDKKKQEGYLDKGKTRQGLSGEQWLCEVHGANLLKELFEEFSANEDGVTLVPFRKTKHSVEITKWLVENEPNHLAEVTQLLKHLLEKGEEVLKSEAESL